MPAGAVRVTLPPAQNVVGPEAVIVAVGGGVTVTFAGAEVALQPLPSVTVTVNEPVAFTVIDCEVLAIEPQRSLTYAWDYTVGDPAYDTRSVVTFTLTPTETGTQPPARIAAISRSTTSFVLSIETGETSISP